jgi:hypothetical protein
MKLKERHPHELSNNFGCVDANALQVLLHYEWWL